MFFKSKEKKFKRIEKFPDVTDIDIAFGGYPKDFFNKLLKESESADNLSEWKNRVNMFFFKGGKFEFNKDLDAVYILKGKRIFQAILGSFEPKHENKEAVCAMILRSLEG